MWITITSDFMGKNKNRMSTVVIIYQSIPNFLWGLDFYKRFSFTSQLLEEVNIYKMIYLLRTNFKLKERKKENASICFFPLFETEKGKRIYQIRHF